MELSELKNLCLQIKELRGEVEALDNQKKDKNKELEILKNQVLEHLKSHDLKNFDFGEGKVISVDRFNVSVTDKYKLAEHLKQIGRFDDMFTFNYQSINAYYKEELEAAIERDDIDFKIEGLSEPKHFQMLQVRSK